MQRATTALPTLASRGALLRTTLFARPMSGEIAAGALGKKWKDKESAVENQYFNNEDAALLSKLHDKLKAQTAPSDAQLVSDKDRLVKVLAAHGISGDLKLVDDILAFKYGKH